VQIPKLVFIKFPNFFLKKLSKITQFNSLICWNAFTWVSVTVCAHPCHHLCHLEHSELKKIIPCTSSEKEVHQVHLKHHFQHHHSQNIILICFCFYLFLFFVFLNISSQKEHSGQNQNSFTIDIIFETHQLHNMDKLCSSLKRVMSFETKRN